MVGRIDSRAASSWERRWNPSAALPFASNKSPLSVRRIARLVSFGSRSPGRLLTSTLPAGDAKSIGEGELKSSELFESDAVGSVDDATASAAAFVCRMASAANSCDSAVAAGICRVT